MGLLTIQTEQHHLRLCGTQDKVTEFFHLHTSLEGQLELATLDDDIREIEQMYLQGI